MQLPKHTQNPDILPDQRLVKLNLWLQSNYPKLTSEKLCPLQNDASCRRYFRINGLLDEQGNKLIAVDSPPNLINNRGFVATSKALNKIKLRAPQVVAYEKQQGFFLVTDLGDDLYLKTLNQNNANKLYQVALKRLAALQTITELENYQLPLYDTATLEREMGLCIEWYFSKLSKHHLTTSNRHNLQNTFAFLCQNALTQPQTFVHRDYHSRNLLCLPENELGILDFQDALLGPITYDVVSLLKDCYIDWPEELQLGWLGNFYDLVKNTSPTRLTASFAEFISWVDLMGLQRHLKCLGLFNRLHLRDHKDFYLQDLPRVKKYIQKVSERYKEIAWLKSFTNFSNEKANCI